MRKAAFYLSLFSAVLLLAGCLGIGKEDIDPPQSVSYEEDLDLNEDAVEDDDASGAIQTELYLIDHNGYVVPRTFPLPVTESVAKQALEYLVTGGPVSTILPDNFRSVLPEGTELSVNIEDGVAVINFSKEFAEYAPEDELRILHAITWTATQFDTVDAVRLQLDGNDLTEMPVNGTPIAKNLSRKSGINIEMDNVADVTNTRPVTVYYASQTDNDFYFVPVTKRIKGDNPITAAIEQLLKGPDPQSDLFTLLMPDVRLVEDPTINNGIVTLNFNENILGSYDEKLVNQNVLESIVLSVTELEGIEGVSILVNGESGLSAQNGGSLSEPVMRPKKLNMSSY